MQCLQSRFQEQSKPQWRLDRHRQHLGHVRQAMGNVRCHAICMCSLYLALAEPEHQHGESECVGAASRLHTSAIPAIHSNFHSITSSPAWQIQLTCLSCLKFHAGALLLDTPRAQGELCTNRHGRLKLCCPLTCNVSRSALLHE